MKKYAWIYLLVAVLAPLVPVNQQRTLSHGVDSYATHRVIFSDHTIDQELELQGPLTGVGAIIVDYYRKEKLVDVTVEVIIPDSGEVIESTIIPAEKIQDDRFAYASFSTSPGSQGERIKIRLSAPQTTSAAPLAVRYDPETIYPTTQRFEDEQVADGTYAIAVRERVPLWRFVVTNVQNNQEQWAVASSALGISILLTLLALRVGWSSQSSRIKKRIQLGIIITIAILSLLVRLTAIDRMGGVSGGDPYNYLLITQNITELQNPFAGAKRLPGYPLLLIPAFLTPSIDDQIYMETFSALAAAGSLIMLYLLIRRLGLPWPIQLFTPAIIALQKDFFWTSVRPEPYSFFTLLFLTTLVLFFSAKTWKGYLGFGIALGYAAMTRQEGFVVAFILGLVALGQAIWRIHTKQSTVKKDAKQLATMFLPALLLITPFLIHNTLEFGNPIFTPYFEGERLQIVDSWPAFKDSAESTWGVLGSMWKPSWDSLERYARTDRWFIGISIATVLFAAAMHYLYKIRNTAVSASLITTGAILAITFIWTAMTQRSVFGSLFPHAVAAIMFVASIPFLYYTKWKGALVWVLLVSQILIPTWFHPFAKHYQQSYPLLALLIATALFAPLYLTTRKDLQVKIIQGVFSVALLFPFIITPFFMFEHDKFAAQIDGHNASSALDSVVYRAVQFTRDLEGRVGFDQAYLPVRLYYSDTVTYFGAIEDPTDEEEEAWLEKHQPNFFVSTNANRIFHEPPASWQEIANFKSAGKDEMIFESSVYRLP